MSPKIKENTERISVFLSPEHLEDIKAAAKAKGLNVSAYVRTITIDHLEGTGNPSNMIREYEAEYQKRIAELKDIKKNDRIFRDRKNTAFSYLGGMLRVMGYSIPVTDYERLSELRQRILEV